MNMQPVDSTQIAAVGYDADSRKLAVQFHAKADQPGAIYHYADVPAEIHAGLIGADSVGKFFGANVRGKFQYEKQDQQQA